uniref:Zona pellucida sperm-binding protein 3 n=1 Tax=Dicentrarchus labrax TaxID=13489 RepID=A0A8P4KR20_DICLA
MKTKRHLYILWSVLSLGLLSCALDTYESTFSRRKVFKLGTPKSKPIKLSAGRKSSQRLPASTSPLSQLTSQRPYPPLAPVTPRSMRPGKPQAKIQSDFAYLPDVSVTCSTSDFVVRVKPSFYGLGADAEELKLGSTCKSNGVLRPYGDLLFTYPLTACESVRQSPRGYLIYKYMLHYEPSPKRFPSRAHWIDVDIECRYQRNHHVYQLTVKPTWQTAVVRKRLKGSPNDFQIQLMDDSWSRPAKSKVYPLGKTVNFQVSALHLPTGVKLYINGCYATPSSGSTSSLKYTIIDNLGCMLDSKREPGASRFISRTDKTMRFSLKAFQFTSDPDTEVEGSYR